MTPRPVVAAAIVDSLTRPTAMLCAARSYPADLRGRFELPGGKIDEGETPEHALQREIQEELGTTVTPGPRVEGPAEGWWPILQGRKMAVWLGTVSAGAPEPLPGNSHLELRWVPLAEVGGLDWIGHDREIALAAADKARSLTA